MYYDVVIVGAGISGMTAAREAFNRGMKNVLIVDYQDKAGGFTLPFQDQPGFVREKELFAETDQLPYEIWLQSTVIGFFPGEDGENHQLYVQTPDDTHTVETKKILIASGSVGKPRENLMVAGSRPAGVMTPMMAANLIQKGYSLGEHVILMDNGRITSGLRHMINNIGEAVEIIDEQEWNVSRIQGGARIEQVELVHDDTTETKTCDTLIFSKGRIPCTFFLKGTPVERNRDLAVVINEKGQTNIPGVYAAGSCTDKGQDDHGNSAELAKHVIYELSNDTGGAKA